MSGNQKKIAKSLELALKSKGSDAYADRGPGPHQRT